MSVKFLATFLVNADLPESFTPKTLVMIERKTVEKFPLRLQLLRWVFPGRENDLEEGHFKVSQPCGGGESGRVTERTSAGGVRSKQGGEEEGGEAAGRAATREAPRAQGAAVQVRTEIPLIWLTSYLANSEMEHIGFSLSDLKRL